MPTLGYVEIRPARGWERRERNELGQFQGSVEAGIAAANEQIANDIEDLANSFYMGTGLGWAVRYQAVGGGSHWEVHAEGQWAEAAEFGIPAHIIAPHGKWPLKNKEEGFGPILPPGRAVRWKPDRATPHHILERAGDSVSTFARGIVVSYLP